jgi:hypothetical protein
MLSLYFLLLISRGNSHQRGYLPVAGLPELCADIAAWGTSTLHIPYTRSDVLVGPGTKELLFVLQTVYYGDLLLPSPSCTSFAPQASIAGRYVPRALSATILPLIVRLYIEPEICCGYPRAHRIDGFFDLKFLKVIVPRIQVKNRNAIIYILEKPIRYLAFARCTSYSYS